MSVESDQRAILFDLSRHLEKRIDTALADFRERCGDADIDFEPAMTLALTVLGHFFASGSIAVGADEEAFLDVCRRHYRMGSTVNRRRINGTH